MPLPDYKYTVVYSQTYAQLHMPEWLDTVRSALLTVHQLDFHCHFQQETRMLAYLKQ